LFIKREGKNALGI